MPIKKSVYEKFFTTLFINREKGSRLFFLCSNIFLLFFFIDKILKYPVSVVWGRELKAEIPYLEWRKGVEYFKRKQINFF